MAIINDAVASIKITQWCMSQGVNDPEQIAALFAIIEEHLYLKKLLPIALIKLPDYKALRLARKLSQREVASACGTSGRYLSYVEKGKIKKPSKPIIKALNKLYGLPDNLV